MAEILVANNIYKSYKSKNIQVHAVNGISLEINQGDIIVILGKSGSGKSTLLNILGGIDTPDSGDVIVDGDSLYTLSEDKRTSVRSEKIGFIFQNYNLINELTALENIRLPFDILNKPYDLEYEEDLFAMLEIKERLSFYPQQLSGGERQRFAICRALLQRPAIVLADEATGNIDSKASIRFMQYVKESNEKYNQTYVIVTHDKNWTSVAHKTLFMLDGKLNERENLLI